MSIKKDPKPEICRIEELVRRVKEGDIKLPKFQRLFVWKKSDILRLCESVYKGYPIGSILLWFTNEKLASERQIGDLDINERPDEYPTNYLLDGQQRLSSLCGALYWNGEDINSNWNIYFDLETEEFLHLEKKYPEVWHFPMNKLLETFDFINQCKRFEVHPDKDKYDRNAQKLLRSIKDYKIAAVTIGDMSIKEVAPIFERINSTGRSLTIVDLMRAATWKEGFDLNDALDAVNKSLEMKSFGTVHSREILNNISAIAGFGILKDDLEKLRNIPAEKLKLYAEKCVESYKLAVDFLTTELPLISNSYLPYQSQLTLLVEFFNLCSKPTVHQRDTLKKWFWSTSFSKYFGRSNYSLIRESLNNMRDYAKGNIEDLKIEETINFNFKDFIFSKFSLKSASSKAFALLLASKNPKSLLDGTPVNLGNALSIINKNEYHHLFPKNFLERRGIEQKKINMHINFCITSLSSNRAISDLSPSVYFSQVQSSLGDKLYEILETNLINKEAFEAGLADDYDKFIDIRSELIINYMKTLI